MFLLFDLILNCGYKRHCIYGCSSLLLHLIVNFDRRLNISTELFFCFVFQTFVQERIISVCTKKSCRVIANTWYDMSSTLENVCVTHVMSCVYLKFKARVVYYKIVFRYSIRIFRCAFRHFSLGILRTLGY